MKPRPTALLILLALATSTGATSPPHADAPMRELFLAGGALAICSDLGASACAVAPNRPGRRRAAQFRLDADGVARALDPTLWTMPGAPPAAALRIVFEGALQSASSSSLSSEEAHARLQAVCVRPRHGGWQETSCSGAEATSPWLRLLDVERNAVLAAFERPQFSHGERRRERADLQQSRERGGIEVLQAFVDAARVRARGARPRIAIVTASAFDPFDPVDFYLDVFASLGADAHWWPIDAALVAAVHETSNCSDLDRLRRERLLLPNRSAVYPDLVAEQRRACESPQSLLDTIATSHGVFFAGGDQWRLHRAFLGSDEAPNPWLMALRDAYATGRLVVGGTSAGAAVQSGGAMLSNGTSAEALRGGTRFRLPPEPGCARARSAATAARAKTTSPRAATADSDWRTRPWSTRISPSAHASCGC